MADPFERLRAALADRYEIVHELGRGATATVFLAHDLKHDRLVALKVLHEALGAALGSERFLREIKTAARLTHPHILPLFDSGVAAGRLFYTMPFVEGETLRHRMRREGRLPVDAAVRIARQVAEALDYAHSRGVVHRDVKPENIMLSATGHVLLADFGIAHVLDESAATGLTETGIVLGTPAYMSPEQSSGDQTLDGRTDVYSLGSVLFEMLTGVQPYTGPNARAVIAGRLCDPVPAVTDLRDMVPVAIDRAVYKAMSLDVEDRFATAADFVAALASTEAPVATPPERRLLPRNRWRRRPVALAAAALLAMAAGVGLVGRRALMSAGDPATNRKMLAVLPLKNLGPPGDEYFADGLTEEITARLAGLSGLGVISRTSANQYKNTTKSLKQIGEELGVSYVLEGSVRWERTPDGRGRIRVTPQLIKVADDSHLWTDRYDAELTEVFEIQARIAEQVTTALDVAIREPERRALGAGATKNSEAYDYYLRGNDYANRSWSRGDITNAVELYERAVALDPNFAAAWAKLARMYAMMYWYYYDRSQTRLDRAKEAAERALRLAPGLPEGHSALGYYYYWGYLDYDHALEQFNAARAGQPSNSELLRAIGLVQRRQGKWDAALASFRAGLELDPRSHFMAFDLADAYSRVRDYAAAERYVDRAIALMPEWSLAYWLKAELYLAWKGDLAQGRAVLRRALQQVPLGELALLLVGPNSVAASLLTADTSFARALDALTLEPLGEDSVRYYQLKAESHYNRHNTALARVYADSARTILEGRLRADSTDSNLRARLGLALAMLGRRADAMREGRRAVELLASSPDAVGGPARRAYLARIYTMLGEPDAAIDQLAHLLSIPSWISVPELRADPVWNPLRGHPRFRRLLAGEGRASSQFAGNSVSPK